MIRALFALLGASLAGSLGHAIGIVPSLTIVVANTIAVGAGAMVVLPRMAECQ